MAGILTGIDVSGNAVTSSDARGEISNDQTAYGSNAILDHSSEHCDTAVANIEKVHGCGKVPPGWELWRCDEEGTWWIVDASDDSLPELLSRTVGVTFAEFKALAFKAEHDGPSMALS